ncbi:hypothetical protein [Hymenobacter cheonanensis]|uniref:hypothetical protein n=1 Tax=Hymenobacter sp. CA2-7 TaxID=3063993 RepID=UPI002712422C|nr:hypothetical protein [Hymenobacter sp. CA2-7]MDO7884457.1 hypothetical protein [Hymenobacter sp. CA2-7]
MQTSASKENNPGARPKVAHASPYPSPAAGGPPGVVAGAYLVGQRAGQALGRVIIPAR